MPSRFFAGDESVGERLRRLRTEHGSTQEELAERAGVSVDLVKKLEQGRRESARLTTLTALARALDVPRSAMLDRRPRVDGSDAQLVLGLRDALLSPDVLTGVDPHDDDATPLDQLWWQIEHGWREYWSGKLDDLAATVPALIAEARFSSLSMGPPAAGPLAQAYQLAACLLVHFGREDLAALGAERGIAAAKAGDDELQWATLHGTYSWALLNQARYPEAERLAIGVAERIEPRLSSATPAHLTVWGGLVLSALAGAAEAGESDRVGEYISLARAGAARFERDRYDYQVNYGPTQVAMQTTYVYAVLGESDKAINAAKAVRIDDLKTISYGRHLLDIAQAHKTARRYDTATTALKRAKDLAPLWFRQQPLAHMLVVEVAERRSRLTPVLRELIRALRRS